MRHSLRALAWLCATAVVCAAAPAQAQRFTTTPMLRVETGAHAGAITALATDQAQRYLITSGADKTIRLWSRETGEQLKVIRPPIGEGPRGNVLALAMAPDGSTVVAGGTFCIWHQKTACLLVFDTASGRLTKRIDGLPSRASSLHWTRDGQHVAAGLREGGLRVYRTSDWSEAGRDEDYGDDVNEIDSAPGGRLATGSDDRHVRLYSLDAGGLKLTAKRSTTELRNKTAGVVRSVQFSPDATRLAIGQTRGSSQVSVLDASNLQQLYAADSRFGPSVGSSYVRWSPDGEYLFAGTQTFLKRPLFVRRWSSSGRGLFSDWPVGVGAVQGMAVIGGGIAFGTSDGVMGLYDANGKLAWERTPQTASFYGTTGELRLSQDGTRVQFAYDDSGRSILSFDLAERRLSAGESRVPLRAAATAGGTMNFFNQWRDTRGTLQAGSVRLAMAAQETSRSLSIAPDNGSFVVGTNAQLRKFTPEGRQVWAVPAFQAYAVNHSGDGRLVVVASGDGTLRWYNEATGRFLAALYVAPDRKRWVLATPSGYYDSSVGAEDFLGWHLNRSPDAESDFMPVSRFRARFYKPDVVASILRSGDDRQAVQLATAELAATSSVTPPKPVAPRPPAAATPPKPVAPPVTAAPPKPVAPPVAAAPPKPVVPPPVVAAPPKPEPAPPVVIAPPKPEPSPPVAVAPPPLPVPPPAPSPATVIPEPETAGADVEVASTVQQTVVDISRVLPPVVTILSPAPGADFSAGQVTVRYLVRTEKDAPLTGVRARVNGLAHDSRTLQIAPMGEVREITVNVPQEDSEIMLFAENRHGISAAASVKLSFKGKVAPRGDDKPVLYVLAIGVSAYEKPEYRLNYAAKDAQDFVKVVQQQKGRLYGDVVVRTLTDTGANSKSVVEGFDWLQKQVTPKDVGMVFIAGHGINDSKGKYYFMPANADLDRLEQTGVPFNEIRNRLSNLRGKGLLFVDTCHSGNVMGGRAGYSNDVNGVLNELSSAEYGLVVLASSTGKQFSLEDPAWANGAFTKALVEGLSGQADLKKRGRITHKMLDFYVSDRVDELTKGQQTPVNPSPAGVPDYPIALAGS